MARLEPHPICKALPKMTPVEFSDLRESIEESGQLEPVFLYEGKILDGRHRYEACLLIGIEPWTVEFEGEDPVDFCVSRNLRRRNLTPTQLAMAAARLATLPRGRPSAENKPIGSFSRAGVASALGASNRSVIRARRVLDHGVPRLVQQVDEGKISLGLAEQLSYLPRDRQEELAWGGKESIGEIREAYRTWDASRRAVRPGIPPKAMVERGNEPEVEPVPTADEKKRAEIRVSSPLFQDPTGGDPILGQLKYFGCKRHPRSGANLLSG